MAEVEGQGQAGAEAARGQRLLSRLCVAKLVLSRGPIHSLALWLHPGADVMKEGWNFVDGFALLFVGVSENWCFHVLERWLKG